jgi:hypothetical protein
MRASAAWGLEVARILYLTSSVSESRNTSKSSSPDSAWFVKVPCEAESTVTADVVQHAAAVQRPEPQVLDENRDDGSSFNGRVTRKRLNPTDVELLPRHERRPPSIEIRFATPNRDCRLIEIAARRFAVHHANRAVRKWQFPGVAHEAVDCLSRWTSNKEHQCLRPKRDC